MKSGRGSTHYSPIRRMHHNKQDDFNSSQSAPTTPMKLEVNINHNQLQHQRAAKENPASPLNRYNRDSTTPISNLLDLDSREPQRVAIEGENNFEEVYVCDCCGISKVLKPSIKFMSTFRSLFFLFNFLAFAFGLASFGMGLWFRIDPKVYEIHKYIETQNFTIAGWILLAGGFFACIISFAGFAAAAKQAAGLLMFYFSTMIILTVAFVGSLVLLTVYGLGYSLEQFLIKEIYEQIRRRSMNTELDLFETSGAAQFLDFIQVKMRCCGAADFRDYGKLGMVVPTTCYTIDKNYVSAPGCGHSIRQLFDLRAGLAIGFCSGSILSQLLALILAAAMFCSIYHWRANPRPATPTPSIHNHSRSVHLGETRRTSTPNQQLYLQQPRSRTPIVI